MFKWISILAVALAMVAPVQVQAQDASWYIGGSVTMWGDSTTELNGFGTAELESSTGIGFMVGVEEGPWRAAFEYGSHDVDLSIQNLTGNADIESFMGSLTWATPTGVKDVEFYVGGGIGMQQITSDGFSDTGVTTLLRFGLEYGVEQHHFGFGYKHQFFDDATLGLAEYGATDFGGLELSYRFAF